MPGAVQVPQPGGVTLDTALPPRFVWHITWDALKADGSQPDMEAVSDYLISKGYCPHIMWNPFTGEMLQYYPASVGSRALMYNDQDGAVCVQIEVFFTPGCVVDGVKYETVADTPLKGWAELIAWAESLGVPSVWPMGEPQWQNNSRDVATWNSNAGHYGHCNSPGDTHTDPGPMPALTGITTQGYTPQEDDLANVTDDQLNFMLKALGSLVDNAATKKDLADQAVKTPAQVWAYQNPSIGGGDAFQHLRDIPAAVLNQTFVLPDGTKTNLAGILTAINAKPVTGDVVVNSPATDPQAILDAIVNGVNIQITKK